MRNHQLSAFLLILIYSTSLNHGQKINGNDRRASGLVPYPRIGRNSELVNFPRSDRAAGLVHYPRVGRSDLPVSNINFNPYNDIGGEMEFEVSNPHEMNLDSTTDQDYEGYSGRPISLRNVDKNVKDGIWLIPDHVHVFKDFRLIQKIDDPRSLYSNTRGPPSNRGQITINGYTPRLGRSTNHDVVMSFI